MTEKPRIRDSFHSEDEKAEANPHRLAVSKWPGVDLNSDVSESRSPGFTPSPAISPTDLLFPFVTIQRVRYEVQLLQVCGGGSRVLGSHT